MGYLFEFEWDDIKDAFKRRQFGFGFQEVVAMFDAPCSYRPNDFYPEQCRVTGFVPTAGDLFTVAYEERFDAENTAYVHLITFWRASPEERKAYEKDH